MKRTFLPVLILAVLGAIFPNWRLDGAPLKEADICEGAAWFAHVDFDALRSQKDWKKLVAFSPWDKPEVVEFQEKTGFDLRKNLTGLTLSGAGKKNHVVWVVRHNLPSTDKLAAWFVAEGNLEHKGGTIYGAKKKKREGFLDFIAPGVILTAKHSEDLAKAQKQFKATKIPHVPALFNDLAKANPENRPVLSAYFVSSATWIPSRLRDAIHPARERAQEFALLFGRKGEALQLDLCAKLYDDDEGEGKAAEKFAERFYAEMAKVLTGETQFDESSKWAKALPILKRVKIAANAQVLSISAEAAPDEIKDLLFIVRDLAGHVPERPDLRRPPLPLPEL